MIRATDAISKDTFGKIEDYNNFSLNALVGGEYGYTPAHGSVDSNGVHYAQWMNSAKQVPMNVIPILLTYPKGFDYYSGIKRKLIGTLKNLVESRAKNITGLNGTITTNTVESQLGFDGTLLKQVSNAQITPTEVIMEVDDIQGNAFEQFITFYQTELLPHPVTGMAGIGRNKNFNPDVYTLDYYTFSMIFIEPDITGRIANRVWLVMNMAFTNNFEFVGSRTPDAKAISTASLNLGGFALTSNLNKRLLPLGQSMLSKMAVHKLNPGLATLPTKGDKMGMLDDLDKANVGYNRNQI